MSKKKIKVKVKKRKIKVKRIIIFMLVIALFCLSLYFISKLPIKNIYVIGNKIVSDKEIIDTANLGDYPSFLGTSNKNIIGKLNQNIYIKNVEVKKRPFNKLYVYITEKKILCLNDNKVLFEDGMVGENIYNITTYPILISDISSIKEKFITKFSLIEDSILLKISEVEYLPNDVDNERFVFKMNDDNLVYITLNKIEKINKYNSIYSNMDGKKGIIYLDSGDYIEVKEE